jgi:hypothetical protein
MRQMKKKENEMRRFAYIICFALIGKEGQRRETMEREEFFLQIHTRKENERKSKIEMV